MEKTEENQTMDVITFKAIEISYNRISHDVYLGDTIIGKFDLLLFESTFSMIPEIYIEIYPPYQNKKYSKLIYNNFIDNKSFLPYYKFCCAVVEDANIISIKLHRSMGFDEVVFRDNYRVFMIERNI